MTRHPETYLNVDWKEMGAGGIDSWSKNAWPMEQYRIASGVEHSYDIASRPWISTAAIESKVRETF